ncbi:MAG TPA: hypothetical protein VGG74_37460 [Kofleriaceae bacterium]|jgi:hypothetical protein
MRRLASLLVVVVAACGSSFQTGPADLTGITPAIMSAGAVSFTGSDATGATVLGWKLQFFSNGSGYDCLSNNANELADIDIFTNQPPNGDARATLQAGADLNIDPNNPPTVAGTAVAHMAVDGIKQVNGDLMLTDVHITSSNEIDRIGGMVNAAGMSASGDTIEITGTFTAPVCE